MILDMHNFLRCLKVGFEKTSEIISGGIQRISGSSKLRSEAISDLEDVLISTDMGVMAAKDICKSIAEASKSSSEEDLKHIVRQRLLDILSNSEKAISIYGKPHVIMICGVNGNGKTTTVAKLAARFSHQNYKIILAASDTFRSAAQEQLGMWGDSIDNAELVFGTQGADPASVVHRAMSKAMDGANPADIVIVDTAGRLHNNQNLMEELAKCSRVARKFDANAPHDVILVIDGTTGQNAYAQIEKFKKFANITGIIVTKLDSSSKGGCIIGIAQKYGIPIYAVGVGEGVEDLHAFSAKTFVEAFLC